jgi:hypothetical protein
MVASNSLQPDVLRPTIVPLATTIDQALACPYGAVLDLCSYFLCIGVHPDLQHHFRVAPQRTGCVANPSPRVATP